MGYRIRPEPRPVGLVLAATRVLLLSNGPTWWGITQKKFHSSKSHGRSEYITRAKPKPSLAAHLSYERIISGAGEQRDHQKVKIILEPDIEPKKHDEWVVKKRDASIFLDCLVARKRMPLPVRVLLLSLGWIGTVSHAHCPALEQGALLQHRNNAEQEGLVPGSKVSRLSQTSKRAAVFSFTPERTHGSGT